MTAQARLLARAGAGRADAAAPLTGVTDFVAAIRTVTSGRNDMPPFGASFTPEQIRDVSAYIVGTLAAPLTR